MCRHVRNRVHNSVTGKLGERPHLKHRSGTARKVRDSSGEALGSSWCDSAGSRIAEVSVELGRRELTLHSV